MKSAEPDSLVNVDQRTVAGFGREWSYFPQTAIDSDERRRAFEAYFRIFPWKLLPEDGGCGADIGCGSGRWALLVAPRVRRLHLVDASDVALEVARHALAAASNIEFHHSGLDRMPIEDGTLDFAYSLGVLHHVPDPALALTAIGSKLKPGAPLLVYLYYALDNRPVWYRGLWRASNAVRLAVSRLPFKLRLAISGAAAFLMYLPLARLAELLEREGMIPHNWPLSSYRHTSFSTMRTDALDRFGTFLERRFTRAQVKSLLANAGFANIVISEAAPYWCAVGIRTKDRIGI